MSFADHFSTRAAEYAQFRPSYPPELFEFLRSLVSRRRLAWDCGTGSGQAAFALGSDFEQVVATDPSAAQLAQARPHPHVNYREGREASSGLPNASVDLVTAAQAAHWFDLPAFYREVERVLCPGGILAMWCYELMTIGPEIDRVVSWFYNDRVGRYWPAERRHTETGYKSLPFPYETIPAPPMSIVASLDRAAILGYIGTWSAVTRCRRAQGVDPMAELAERLVVVWPDEQEERRVSWPISVRAGRAP